MEPPCTLKEVNDLIKNRVQESLHLDYKSSSAIDDGKRKEIAKDVSAFANSDGGILIYAVEESGHLPTNIDSGVDHEKYSREWLEHVLDSNISPKIDGVIIKQIPLNDLRSLFVISIPKSMRGPHQDRNTKRYYKRYNFKSSPMEDYEISDIRNRTVILSDLINIDISIEYGVMVYVEIENIGDAAAQEVKITSPKGFWKKERNNLPSFFKRPIKSFPSGKKFKFFYNTFQDVVNNEFILEEFTLNVEYVDTRTGDTIRDNFYFNLDDYMGSDYSEPEIHKLGKILKESIKKLSKNVEELNENLKELTRISGPTGLNISVTALNNIESLLESGKDLKKIDPEDCDWKMFKEILCIRDNIAISLERYFQYYWRNKSLLEVDGIDEEIISRLKEKFVLDDRYNIDN
ncbi:MAG: ATP-binding protein [Candidatus Thiodiazotropha taylori]|nr:ATP-binding protein [Candidatus Thiodiazotropha taylori]